MASVWKHKRGDTTYEVRSAGNSLRLYTNGAFHSQHNPQYLFTGAIWDLLTLPSLCSTNPPENVLLLGVGGGTAIHQLSRLHELVSLTGIDIDQVHLQVAIEIFGVSYPHTQLICDDARDWLASHQSKHDLLVDDIFQHADNWRTDDPYRPHKTDRNWFRMLTGHLSRNGMLIQNHIDPASARHARKELGALGYRLLTFTNDGYANQVIAACRSDTSARQLKRNLETRLAAMPRRETSRLRFQCRVS